MKRVTTVVCCLLLLGSFASAEEPGIPSTIASAREVGAAFTAVARKAVPAVVFIQVEREVSRDGRIVTCIDRPKPIDSLRD